jgi:hypothetical protein
LSWAINSKSGCDSHADIGYLLGRVNSMLTEAPSYVDISACALICIPALPEIRGDKPNWTPTTTT